MSFRSLKNCRIRVVRISIQAAGEAAKYYPDTRVPLLTSSKLTFTQIASYQHTVFFLNDNNNNEL